MRVNAGIIAAAGAVPWWAALNPAFLLDASEDLDSGATAPTVYAAVASPEVLTLAAGSGTGIIAASTPLGGAGYIGDATRYYQAAGHDPGDLATAWADGQDWTLVVFAEGPSGTDKRILGNRLGAVWGVQMGTTTLREYYLYFDDAEGDEIDHKRVTWSAGTVRTLRYELVGSTGVCSLYVDGTFASSDTDADIGSLVTTGEVMAFLAYANGTRVFDADIGMVAVFPTLISGDATLKAAVEAHMSAEWTAFGGDV